MSGKRLQLKRGTTAQTSTFTGLNGEVTVDTTKKTLVVHDGATIGGTVLAKDSDVTLKVDKVAGKQLSTEDYSTAEKSKLAGISASANNYTHPTSGVGAGTYKSVTVDVNGHVTGGTNPTTVSGYGLTDVYTKTESNTSLALKVNNSEKGVANGVATLDVNGKVVLTQIPDSVLGQLEYMGTHNFTTLPTATQKGQYWIANVSGNGYIVGDWAVWNGSAFDKVDNTDAVATVAGRTGNVVLTKSDVGLANVDNTADSAKNVLSASKLTTARTVGMTGDVTWTSTSFDGTGNVTGTSTLANSGVTAGTYGSASLIPTVTVDAKGRVTSIGTNSVSIPSGAISVTGGDLTMSGSTGTAITNATLNSVGTAGTYTKVTTDSKGRVTSGTSPTTLSGYGITDAVAKVTSTDNAIVRFDGTTGNVQNSGVTIDDNNNVGIGTTTPYKIANWKWATLDGTNGSGITCRVNGVNTAHVYSTTNGTTISEQRALPLIFETSGAERMRIDSAGNVGIGATPSAWTETHKAIQFPGGGSLYNNGANNGYINLTSNNYYDGSNWRYINSTGASNYVQVDGNHYWSRAPSGTAGSPITWTTAMTLGSNGNLLVGTATDNGVDKLQVNGGIIATSPYDVSITAQASGAWFDTKSTNTSGDGFGGWRHYNSSGVIKEWVYTAGDSSLAFGVNGAERMRIDSSGNLLLTSSTGGLGYGTGAGGTVTQLTSKSTTVTLNKPTGRIIMHTGTLGIGASVTFLIYNSAFSTNDTVILTGKTWSAFYRIEDSNSSTGIIGIQITNISGESRSDPVEINFVIIKGAES